MPKKLHPFELLMGTSRLFLESLFNNLEQAKVDVSNLPLDHLCYRLETNQKYNALKSVMCKAGVLLSENVINGRPISVVRLTEPIIYESRQIHCIELPAPKPGKHQPEGYEHAEFVVPHLAEFCTKYPGIQFKHSTLPYNNTSAIYWGDMSARFHERPLELVVELQRASQK